MNVAQSGSNVTNLIIHFNYESLYESNDEFESIDEYEYESFTNN